MKFNHSNPIATILSRRKNLRRAFQTCGAAAALLCGAVMTQAQSTDTWTGADSANFLNWSDAANWLSASAPNPGDNLVFDDPLLKGSLSPTNDFAADTAFGGIVFAPGLAVASAADTLVGNEIIIGRLVENDATNLTETINLPLVLTNAVTFNTSSNDLNGGASDDIYLGSNVSGSGSLIKIGTGNLFMTNGVNSYSGVTTISNGLVDINRGGTYTMSGGALLLDYRSYSSGLTITFTADSSVGISLLDNTEPRGVDTYSTIGTAGYQFTKIGVGILRMGSGINASTIDVAEGTLASLGGGVGGGVGIEPLTKWGTAPITVENGAMLRADDGGVCPNAITLNGGDGTSVGSYTHLGALISSSRNNGASTTNFNIFTNTIILAGSSTIGSYYNTTIIAGNISGPGALTTLGNALTPMLLSGSNSFTGGLTLNTGVLQAGSSNALPVGANVTVNGGSKLDLDGNIASVGSFDDDGQGLATLDNSSTNPVALTVANGGMSFSGTIQNSGGGALSIIGVSAGLSLEGGNKYTGSTMVEGGALDMILPTANSTGGLLLATNGASVTLHFSTPGSSLPASGVTLGNYSGDTTSLTIDLNNFGDVAKPVINATNGTGALSANGTINVTINGQLNMTVGSIHLIKYTSLTGSGTSFVLNPITGVGAAIVTNAANKSIDLNITSAPITTWTARINTNWDYMTSNWIYAGIKTNYADNEGVFFDNTASNFLVNLTATLTPGSVSVNSSSNYLFTGPGSLSGGVLTKSGSGTLILDVNNSTYSSTTIGAGTLQVGNNDNNGDLGSGNVNDQATLSFNLNSNYSVQGVISGAGNVVQNNTNTLASAQNLTLSQANTYSGGTLVNAGVVKLGNNAALGAPAGTLLASVASGGSLDLAGKQISSSAFVSISGSGASANVGALQNSSGYNYCPIGCGQIGLRFLSLAGNASIGDASGTIALGIDNNLNCSATTVGCLDGQGYILTKVGNSLLELAATNKSALSQFIITAGGITWANSGSGSDPIGATCSVTISNNASIDAWDNDQNTGISVPNNFTIGVGGAQFLNDHGTYFSRPCWNTFSGAFTLIGDLRVTANNYQNGVAGQMNFTGAISGSGGVATVCSPTANAPVTLSGLNTYTGSTISSNAPLLLSSRQQGGGAYLVYDNSTLDVPAQNGYPTVPMSSLMVGSANGGALSLSRLPSLSTTTAPVTATNLSVIGSSSVVLPAIAFLAAPGEYPLIKYTTGPSGYGTVGTLSIRGAPGYITNDTANSEIAYVVPGGTPVVWTGTGGNNLWDINTTLNWATNGTATTYQQAGSLGDVVTFNDSSSATTVNVSVPVTPAAAIFNITNKNYLLIGTNLTGSASLVKNGTGTLVLSNFNNNFTGGTVVSAGTLQTAFATNLALNNLTGTVTLAPGATLDMGSNNLSTLVINASGTGVGGNGAIQANYSGTAQGWGVSVVNMNSNLTIGGNARWDVRNGANQFNVTSASNTLTKVGAGFVGLVGTTVSTNLGDIFLNGGKLSYENGTTGLGNTNNTIWITNGAALDFYSATVPLAKSIVLSNGAAISTSGGSGGNNVLLGPLTIGNGANVSFNVGNVLNIACPVNIPSGCTVNNNGNYYGTITYSNVISGSGTFNMQYQSYIRMAASNTFSGSITVPQCNSGYGTVLYLQGNGSLTHVPSIYMQGISPGSQASPGHIDVSGRVDGTLTLAPNQTLRGDLGSTINGTVAAGPATTIFPGGDNNTNCCYMAMTNLILSGGVLSFDVLPATNDQIWVTGNLNVSAGGIIRVIYSSLPVGRYHLMPFGTETGTAAANLQLVLNGPRYTAYLDDQTTPHMLDLVVSSTTIPPPQTLTWAGDGVNNYWDTDVSLNWMTNTTSPKTDFYYGDNVSFTDPGTNPIVTLVGTVSPASITVNSAANYTFAGSGAITGNTSLNKTNTGSLFINTANTFAGGTTISGGTLVLGNSGALWNNTNSVVTVTNGGTLDMATFNPNATTVNLSGAGVGGNGALIANYGGAAQLNGPSIINLIGSATIGGTNRFSMRNGSHMLNCPTNAFSLTKVGTNFVDFYTTLISTNLGDVILLGGMFGYEGSVTGLGCPTNTLWIGTNAIFEMYSATVPLNKFVVLSNGASIQPDSGGGGGGPTTTQNIISGPIYLAGPAGVANPAQINCNYNNGCAISNTISGPGGLSFNYNAYNRLYAPNTYTGDTSIYGGVYLYANSCIVSATNVYENGGPLFLTNNAYVNCTLLHDNLGAVILGQSATILSTNLWLGGSGYLDASGRTDGTLTLANGQSLRGDNGSYVKGNAVATSGSALTPGGLGFIQTLSFSNNLTLQAGSVTYLDVSRNGGTLSSDLINVSNLLTYGGSLVISNAGPNLLGVGDTFTVFKAGMFSGSLLGSYSSQTPWQTVTWTTTATPGQIQVATATTNLPALTTSTSGSNLGLSWPANFIGGTVQTNSVGLNSPSSWYNYPTPAYATNINITINPNQPNVFYRLTHP